MRGDSGGAETRKLTHHFSSFSQKAIVCRLDLLWGFRSVYYYIYNSEKLDILRRLISSVHSVVLYTPRSQREHPTMNKYDIFIYTYDCAYFLLHALEARFAGGICDSNICPVIQQVVNNSLIVVRAGIM